MRLRATESYHLLANSIQKKTHESKIELKTRRLSNQEVSECVVGLCVVLEPFLVTSNIRASLKNGSCEKSEKRDGKLSNTRKRKEKKIMPDSDLDHPGI